MLVFSGRIASNLRFSGLTNVKRLTRDYKKWIIMRAVVLAYLAAGPCLAQQPVEKFTARVQITVSGSDDIKREVSSYLKREFRSLGDVEETETKPYYRIRVVASSTQLEGGHTAGFVLSVLITRQFYIDDYTPPLKLDAKGSDFLKNITKNHEEFLTLLVRMGGSKDLQKLCKEVVAEIDSDYIELDRKEWQQVQELSQKHDKTDASEKQHK